MTLISESRLRQIIREAIEATASTEDALLSAGFEDIQQGLEIARKKASGKPMGFVKDVDGFYAYAAIGGNLEVGPEYAPEMFVVIHDGLRPDRKSLGAVFRPSDKPPKADQFLAYGEQSQVMQDPQFKAHVLDIAKKLSDAYAGGNSYDFLVSSVRAGVLPAGKDVQQVAAQAAPPASPELPPAAPASSPDAATAVADAVAETAASTTSGTDDKAKPKFSLSSVFRIFKRRPSPGRIPAAPGRPGRDSSGVARSGAGRAGEPRRRGPPAPQYSAVAWNSAWDELNATERAIVAASLTGSKSVKRIQQMIVAGIEADQIRDFRIKALIDAGVPGGSVTVKGVGVNKGPAANVVARVKSSRDMIKSTATRVHTPGDDASFRLIQYPNVAALLVAASEEFEDRSVSTGNVSLVSK